MNEIIGDIITRVDIIVKLCCSYVVSFRLRSCIRVDRARRACIACISRLSDSCTYAVTTGLLVWSCWRPFVLSADRMVVT